MASAVKVLEAELEVARSQIKEIDEEYKEQTFPEEIKERWNRLNRTIDEYEKKIELLRRQERVEELAARANHVERIDGDIQFAKGGSWKSDPFDLTQVDRDWSDPEKEGKQLKDRSRIVIEKNLNFRHSNAEPDRARERMIGF